MGRAVNLKHSDEIDERENELYWAEFAASPPKVDQRLLDRLKVMEQGKVSLDRIYYINLPYRPLRREMMEGWLGRQPIPFYRVEPLQGSNDDEQCGINKRDPPGRCRAISSLARTVLGIIRDKNTTGFTLVLEDDYQVDKPLDELIETSLQVIPSDWDIIRWDCTGELGPLSKPWRTQNATIFQTVLSPECQHLREIGQSVSCWFCGGTHAHLWRGSSVHKLVSIWSELPYNDIDCRLTNPQIKSYCINFDSGIGRFMHSELPGEFSDVTFLSETQPSK